MQAHFIVGCRKPELALQCAHHLTRVRTLNNLLYEVI